MNTYLITAYDDEGGILQQCIDASCELFAELWFYEINARLGNYKFFIAEVKKI